MGVRRKVPEDLPLAVAESNWGCGDGKPLFFRG